MRLLSFRNKLRKDLYKIKDSVITTEDGVTSLADFASDDGQYRKYVRQKGEERPHGLDTERLAQVLAYLRKVLKLSETEISVFTLRFYEGWPFLDIGVRLGLSHSTAQNITSRIKRRIREAMTGDAELRALFEDAAGDIGDRAKPAPGAPRAFSGGGVVPGDWASGWRAADERKRQIAARLRQYGVSSLDGGDNGIFGPARPTRKAGGPRFFSGSPADGDHSTGNIDNAQSNEGSIENKFTVSKLKFVDNPRLLIIRYWDADGKPLAYIVTYLDNNGRLCLRYAARYVKELSIAPPGDFRKTLEELERECQGRADRDKRLYLQCFTQANVMWAGSVFQDELQSVGLNKPLLAFIRTKERLKPYGEVGEANLEQVLGKSGYRARFMASYYKLYQHYLELGLAIPARFAELLESEPPLKAFIQLFNEAKDKDRNFELLKPSHLQEVLVRCGHKVSYISICYELYQYYFEKGLDLPARFAELLESEPPLKAFIQLFNEAKDKDMNCNLLKPGNLEGVLKMCGYEAKLKHMGNYYKIYMYWKEKGLDLDVSYNVTEYDKKVIRKTSEAVEKIGLPPGKYMYSAGFYLRDILVALGKITETSWISLDAMPKSVLSTIEYERQRRVTDPAQIAEINEGISELVEVAGPEEVQTALESISMESLTEGEKSQLDSTIFGMKKKVFAHRAQKVLTQTFQIVGKKEATEAEKYVLGSMIARLSNLVYLTRMERLFKPEEVVGEEPQEEVPLSESLLEEYIDEYGVGADPKKARIGVDKLARLARNLISQENLQKARECLDAAYGLLRPHLEDREERKKMGWKLRSIAIGYHDLASRFIEKDEINYSRECLDTLYAIFQNNKDISVLINEPKFIIAGYNHLVISLAKLGRLIEAKECADRAYEIFKEPGHEPATKGEASYVIGAYNNLGSISIREKRLADSMAFIGRSYEIFQEYFAEEYVKTEAIFIILSFALFLRAYRDKPDLRGYLYIQNIPIWLREMMRKPGLDFYIYEAADQLTTLVEDYIAAHPTAEAECGVKAEEIKVEKEKWLPVIVTPPEEKPLKIEVPPAPRKERPLSERMSELQAAIRAKDIDEVERQLGILSPKLEKAGRKGNVPHGLEEAINKAEGFLAKMRPGPSGAGEVRDSAGGTRIKRFAPERPPKPYPTMNDDGTWSDGWGKDKPDKIGDSRPADGANLGSPAGDRSDNGPKSKLPGVLGMARDGEDPDKNNENQSSDKQHGKSAHDQSPSLLINVAMTNVPTKNATPETKTSVRNGTVEMNCPITNAAKTSLPTSYKALANSVRCDLPNLIIGSSVSQEASGVKDVENRATVQFSQSTQQTPGASQASTNLLENELGTRTQGQAPDKPGLGGPVDKKSASSPELTKEDILKAERIQATLLGDSVKRIPEKEKKAPIIVALGTSWIKGYDREKYPQYYSALNPLITSLRQFCESRGMTFIDEEDEKLLERINNERSGKGRENAKVIVLAGENTVMSDDFKALRIDANVFLAGVDNGKLTPDSYVRLVEMLRMALDLAFKQTLETANPNIMSNKSEGFENVYIFLPKAEPITCDPAEIYKVQIFA